MTLEMRGADEFRLVTRRKKRGRRVDRNRTNRSISLDEHDEDENGSSDIDCEAAFGKLLEAETEFRNSSFADDILYRFKDSLNTSGIHGISDILCYGLGNFTSRRSSKYQLALLLLLKKYYGAESYVYDPIFSPSETKLLDRLGFNVIRTNEEGKRVVRDKATLVYMPHCSIHLTNNFLYANWSTELSKCILLTNSFSVVADDSRKTDTSYPVNYILRIQPHVTEIPLRNNFTYEDVFNNLNIHIFLGRNIEKLPKNFWTDREEPRYRDAVVDYLTAIETERIDAKNRNYLSSSILDESAAIVNDAYSVFPGHCVCASDESKSSRRK